MKVMAKNLSPGDIIYRPELLGSSFENSSRDVVVKVSEDDLEDDFVRILCDDGHETVCWEDCVFDVYLKNEVTRY